MAITGGGQNSVKGSHISDILQKCHTQSGWNGAGQEYIANVRKILEDPANPIKIKMHHLSEDAVVFIDGDTNAIILINESEVINLQVLANETKLYRNTEIFHNTFKDSKLLTAITCNRAMFERPNQMANCIALIFSAHLADIRENFNIGSFGDNHSISFDTNLSNVQRFFETKSVSPVVPGTFGFIANVNNNTPGITREPTPLFGVLGNVEFIRNDTNGKFTPVVHINEILSVLPTAKIYALALPLIAEVTIARNLWKQPFTAYGRDTGINIGNLIVDGATQKPYEVKNEADYRTMFLEWVDTLPLLCIDIKSGGADIPGIHRLLNPDTSAIYNEILSFFGDTNIQGHQPVQISKQIFKEITGFIDVNKSKGGAAGYIDSRDLTYLYAVSKLKYQPQFDFMLGRNDVDIQRRFDRIREIFGEVVPTHFSMTALLSNAFLAEMTTRIASSKLRIENFQSNGPAIDLTQYSQFAYQPNASLFGTNQPAFNNFCGWMR